MSDTVTAALIGLGAVLAGGLITGAYTVGGRSALQRRATKQEVELLSALPNGRPRRELSRLIESRVAAYLVRQLPDPIAVNRRRGRQHWRLFGWFMFVGLGGAALTAVVPRGTAENIAVAIAVVAMFGLGALTGISVGRDVRSERATRRLLRYERARKDLQLLENERSEKSEEI